MIQLILFLLVGALLLLSLLVFARRSSQAEGVGETLVEAKQALKALQRGLLPPEVVARIFATGDLEYVRRTAPQDVQALFDLERKRIARSWVRHVRIQVLSLQRFHRGAARFYSRLNVRTEMELALHFMTLLLACRALQVTLYFGGPYATPRMVEATATAAARVCAISEKSLAFLNPSQLGSFDSRSVGPAV